ncbi:hypothetical protein AK812_SmicGene18613 [Symbiodinium microadriaticum]|uniref:Uncharacterized protein n=1 Tax=Symbiodinium microadriaticum TaxID=2951 RepID=A0A1Q9DUP9_SYMMI|nr:hypothetical protein AK812_SmicGene18613 [Symbiodinium microadriaticum]
MGNAGFISSTVLLFALRRLWPRQAGPPFASYTKAGCLSGHAEYVTPILPVLAVLPVLKNLRHADRLIDHRPISEHADRDSDALVRFLGWALKVRRKGTWEQCLGIRD